MFFDDEEAPTAVEDAAAPYRTGSASPATMTARQHYACKVGWHTYQMIGLSSEAMYLRCIGCRAKFTIEKENTTKYMIADYLEAVRKLWTT
jgi:hypothetical protein